MIPSNQRVELIANKNLGFRAVTDRISSNQLNLKLTGLTDGHKYAVETKEQPQQSLNIIERQTPTLSGSTSENIDINLPKTDYVVGRTYYLAVRDLNDDIEVIQASFHIDENLTDGGDSVVIKYLSSQYTVSGNAIDNTNKIQDQEGLIDDIANNAVADAAASSLEVKTYIDNQVATQNEASEISYNNSTSGLTATDVQAAIDEVDGNVDSNDTDISNLQSSKVDKSGSVTQLNDVTSAGSGAIITSSERSNLHNPVTLGTANGLSLSGQTLSLSTATTSDAGALSSTDKTKLDNIESGATNIANHTTDGLSEGSSNLYYTNARVQANRLDQLAKPTSDLDINSNKLTNVTNPTNPQDAATKNYVDRLNEAYLVNQQQKLLNKSTPYILTDSQANYLAELFSPYTAVNKLTPAFLFDTKTSVDESQTSSTTVYTSGLSDNNGTITGTNNTIGDLYNTDSLGDYLLLSNTDSHAIDFGNYANPLQRNFIIAGAVRIRDFNSIYMLFSKKDGFNNSDSGFEIFSEAGGFFSTAVGDGVNRSKVQFTGVTFPVDFISFVYQFVYPNTHQIAVLNNFETRSGTTQLTGDINATTNLFIGTNNGVNANVDIYHLFYTPLRDSISQSQLQNMENQINSLYN